MRLLIRPKFPAAILLAILALSACQRETGGMRHVTKRATDPSNMSDSVEDRSRDLRSAGCSLRKSGKHWCHLDFVRLALNTNLYDSETIYITGFLAIDSGNLVLYASENDFQYKIVWRSLRVRGSAPQLNAIAKDHLYRYVRLEGVFESDDRGDLNGGRLGSLMPPVAVRLAGVEDSRPSINEIRIDYRDLDEPGAAVR